MSITNPAPAQITSWSVEGGVRSFTVSIPTRPEDNDLAGIIVVAKAGAGENPVFPNDVFYRGAWSDLIVVNTDAANNTLLPNQTYTVKVAAFDEFGTDSLAFSDPLEATTLQLAEDDIQDEAVTNPKIPDDEIQSAKISGLVADKITAGTITGSTLQTSSSGQRFIVSVDDEARFYDQDSNLEYSQIASIGAYKSRGIYYWPNTAEGDPNVIYTGGAQTKTTQTNNRYGIEFISAGTAKVFIEDLIPGENYDFYYLSNIVSNATVDMGGATVALTGGVGDVQVACDRPYVLISVTGGTFPRYIYFYINRKLTDAIVYSGSKTSEKRAFYGASKNTEAIKVVSYGTTLHTTLEARSLGNNTGFGISSITGNKSISSYYYAGYFRTSATYTGGGSGLTAIAGVYGETTGAGSAVVGKAIIPFDDNNLQNDCAAFRSESGDCDFRNSVVYFKTYTVSTLPSASIAGGMIYVSDESGGAVMAFSDGTNWRRVTDRAIVS